MSTNAYNKLAGYYDFLVKIIFGNTLLQAKRQFLGELQESNRMLLIGGGSGQILFDILQDNPQNQVVYLEKSGNMTALARKRLTAGMASRVCFIEGDESKLPKDEKFDAVITNFFLDQFREDRLDMLMGMLNDSLKISGKWLFTDFRLQKGQAHYWWQNLLVKTMLAFFKITTRLEANRLPDYDHYFQAQNLCLVEEKYFLKKLIVSRVYRKSIPS